jgi:hypothetical protein
MFFAVDLAMVVNGLTRDDAGKALRRFSNGDSHSIKLIDRNFPGKGNSNTKLVSFKDAPQFILALPGKLAKETRIQITSIIERYMAGDKSMVKEVEANAQSDTPIAQMSEERAAETVLDDESLMRKRRLETLEIETLEYELSSKKQQTEWELSSKKQQTEWEMSSKKQQTEWEMSAKKQQMQRTDLDLTIARRNAELEYAGNITTNYRALCQDTSMDSRAALVLKDFYLNMIMLQPVAAPAAAAPNRLTDGAEPPQAAPLAAPIVSSSRPISLSQVALQMNLKLSTGELISLGGKLKKQYVSKHGQAPGKHDQLCGGRVTQVNSYTESDRPLVEELLRGWSRQQSLV